MQQLKRALQATKGDPFLLEPDAITKTMIAQAVVKRTLGVGQPVEVGAVRAILAPPQRCMRE